MKKIYALVLLLFCNYLLTAQVIVSHKKDPSVRSNEFSKHLKHKVVDVPIPSKEKIKQKELADEKDGSSNRLFRFAESVEINVNVIEQMSWITEGSTSYGTLTIHANKAKSLSINFSEFFIPENAEVFLYSKSRKTVIGPITSKENNKTETWASPVVEGDELIFEVKISNSDLKQAKLLIERVAYGYKDINLFVPLAGGYGQSASCQINANCLLLGSGWEIERRSVALILDGPGERWASGSLIANTCNYNIPYFLTAKHVLNNKNPSNFRFSFHYISPACSPTQDDDINAIIFYGATTRAVINNADIALLELNQIPPTNLGLAYSGWSLSGTAAYTTILHHPRGDVMKIARDNSSPINEIQESVYSHRLELDYGLAENGSSGGPVYDENRRIIGTIFGRYTNLLAPVCDNKSTFVGRFDIAWSGGGTNDTRLSNWLDPSGVGAPWVNSNYVVSTTPAPSQTSISGFSQFCSGPENYSLVNVPSGSSVTWSASPSNVVSISPTSGYYVQLTKIVDGVITLTATITTACGAVTYTVSREISVGTPPPLNYSICGYDPNQDCRYGRIVFSVYTGYTYPTTYSWYVDGVLMATTSDPVWSFVPQVPCDSYIELRVVVTTACGTSSGAGEVIYYACQGGFYSYYSLSPNPAKGKVVVKTKSSDKTKELPQNKKYIKEVRILNKNYIEIKRMQFANLTEFAEVNLPNVPADTYFISVFDGKKWYTEKLLIAN